jgi:hypothetical protein
VRLKSSSLHVIAASAKIEPVVVASISTSAFA